MISRNFDISLLQKRITSYTHFIKNWFHVKSDIEYKHSPMCNGSTNIEFTLPKWKDANHEMLSISQNEKKNEKKPWHVYNFIRLHSVPIN